MKVKVINRSAYDLPQYETAQAAGLDVRADLRESLVLEIGRASCRERV